MFLVVFMEGHHDQIWSNKLIPPAKKFRNRWPSILKIVNNSST